MKNLIFTFFKLLFCILVLLSCNNKSHTGIEMRGKIDTVKFKMHREDDISGVRIFNPGDTIGYSLYPNGYSIPLTVNKKNLPMVLFDTGAGISIFNTDSINYTESADYTESAKNFLISDIRGMEFLYKRISIDSVRIGKTIIPTDDLLFAGISNINYSILGGDILKHYVWYIDNFHGEIYFSRNPSAFNYNGFVSIPFYVKKETSHIYTRCYIGGEEFDVMLDTGYDGFLHVKDNTEINPSVNTAQSKDTSRFYMKKDKHNSLGISNYGTYNLTIEESRTINTVKIGPFTFPDEIVGHNYLNMNVLGFDFFQRFDAVVIDYINKKLYLKTDNEKLMNNTAGYKSIMYLAGLRLDMNSIGIQIFSKKAPYKIMKIDESLIKKGLVLGDILTAIDGKPATAENIESLMFSKDSATITVKRNNKQINFNLSRRNFINEPDTVFSFGEESIYPLKQHKQFSQITDLDKRKGWVIKYYNLE